MPLSPAQWPEPDLARLVARLRAAGCVFAEDEAALLVREAGDRSEPDALARMTRARVGGTPLEQVLGWAELRGVRVAVRPGVFVPRQRTGLLVDVALGWVRPGTVVVDLGCGTGALAAVVRAAVPAADIWAADLDPAAVACARLNLPADRVVEGDLYDALPAALRGRVQVLMANGPYVPPRAVQHLPPEAREHEHRMALDGGADGLDVQRRVVSGARAWLAPGSLILVETGRPQLAASLAMGTAAGLEARTWQDDETGGLVVGGLSPPSAPTAGPGAGGRGRPT
ncbi:MAG: putative protein N(5)-glutamine methyltransferase [Nocardioides sp.]|nr:putative protein N(5)-glutamine methyltransferase [Nocardioides sp.]